MSILVHARLLGPLLAVALSVGLAAGAQAATVNLTSFTRADLAGARQARTDFLADHTVSNLHVETFEGKPAWNGTSGTTNPQNTHVGNFASIDTLGHGAGLSAIHGGAGLEVRSDNSMPWGRYNADALPAGLGGQWLDSNDTQGMTWDVSGLGTFNALSFFLIDAADVGAKFSILVGDTLYSQVLGASGRTPNGNIQLVTILLDKAVDTLSVKLFNDRLNDGFGVDGAMVAHIAPVPVPPAALLLATGLLGLGALRRRRGAAAL